MGQESLPIQQIDGSWDLALKFADTVDLPAGLLLFPRDDELDEEDDGHHLNHHQTHTLFPRSDSNSSSPTPLETYRAISNVVFGIQVAGSLTTENQRNYLCNNNNFKMNPIEGLGLNYDKLKQVICTDIPASQIPLDNKTVADSLQLYNAMLWLQMTFNVFFGNATKLCDMFNVQQAEKVGMDAINIMWYLCTVAYPHGRG
ncbi:hypothetical protein DTO271D3_5634 [Paecilomyces variotii]|nr:hypothetical protein DTO169E5_2780 [Paecilomyces variotii]KAJ9314157.1 hypothetical protein DTO271D3_5634 [Paecilomyces variotii]